MVVVLLGPGSLVQRGLVFTVQRNTKLMQWCDFRLSDLIILRRFAGFLVPKRILIQGFEVRTGDREKNKSIPSYDWHANSRGMFNIFSR